jgi:hypothetical protein
MFGWRAHQSGVVLFRVWFKNAQWRDLNAKLQTAHANQTKLLM